MALARQAMNEGNRPAGSVIVKDGKVVGEGRNLVNTETDPTAHGEVVAIRCTALNLRTVDLSGCTMYTTCEPCPMCAAAIHWARLDACVYGAAISDAATAGFNELHLPIGDVYRIGERRVPACVRRIEGGAVRPGHAALRDP